MERVLAGWFAEASNYLSTAFGSNGGNNGQEEVVIAEKERSSSDVSRGSSCSSRSSQQHKVQRVFGWMVSGSKKVLAKKSSQSQIIDVNDYAHKKSALDILLVTGNTTNRSYEPVDPRQLHALAVIGRGGYAKVMLMKDDKSGKLVAVKQIPKTNLIDKPGSTTTRTCVRPVSTKIEHAEMENLVLHCASGNPFITSFHGSFQNRDSIFLTLEYCPGGELFSLMQKQGIFSESRTRLYVAEITSALEFLHGNGIIYRDLKPENILLDTKGHVRLADFGLSIQFNKPENDDLMRCYSICGTPEYIAPEIILLATTRKNDPKASYSKTVDWWALGILTYEMLFRIPPFYSKDRKTMLNKILQCDLQFPTKHNVSNEALDFITKLLQYDETKRLGAGNDGSKNCKSHPFFDNLNFALVEKQQIQPEYVPQFQDIQDISHFDNTFTREIVRPDSLSPCVYNLEVNGYEYLEDFNENIWYQQQQQQQ